jgi:hypothetical protein
MFARIMSIVSPSIFLASSIVWGLSTGNLIAGVLSVALGVAAAFMSFRAWRKATGGIADHVSSVARQEAVDAVRGAWRKYWKYAAFIAALYCLNLVLGFALRGAYRFGAWDVLMAWYIVDGAVFSSWVELLRARAGKLAGESESAAS